MHQPFATIAFRCNSNNTANRVRSATLARLTEKAQLLNPAPCPVAGNCHLEIFVSTKQPAKSGCQCWLVGD